MYNDTIISKLQCKLQLKLQLDLSVPVRPTTITFWTADLRKAYMTCASFILLIVDAWNSLPNWERRVVNFRKLLFKSDKKKLSFRRVESKKVCSHPGRDLL